MRGHRQLRLLQLGPQVRGPHLTQVVRLRPPLPLPLGQRHQRRGGRIRLQEGGGEGRRQLRHVQRPRIVGLQRRRQLVHQPRLRAHLALIVLGQQLQLLRRLRARLQRLQVGVIRPQKARQHPGIEQVVLGPALAEPIPCPVQGLGIDRVHPHAMVQQHVHHPTLRPLDRRPQHDALRAPFVQLPPPLTEPHGAMRHHARADPLPLLVLDPHRMLFIRPVHSDVVTHGRASFARRSGLRAGTAGCPYTGPQSGPLSMEPLRRSLANRDSLGLSLEGCEPIGPLASKL